MHLAAVLNDFCIWTLVSCQTFNSIQLQKYFTKILQNIKVLRRQIGPQRTDGNIERTDMRTVGQFNLYRSLCPRKYIHIFYSNDVSFRFDGHTMKTLATMFMYTYVCKYLTVISWLIGIPVFLTYRLRVCNALNLCARLVFVQIYFDGRNGRKGGEGHLTKLHYILSTIEIITNKQKVQMHIIAGGIKRDAQQITK